MPKKSKKPVETEAEELARLREESKRLVYDLVSKHRILEICNRYMVIAPVIEDNAYIVK